MKKNFVKLGLVILLLIMGTNNVKADVVYFYNSDISGDTIVKVVDEVFYSLELQGNAGAIIYDPLFIGVSCVAIFFFALSIILIVKNIKNKKVN